jgi:uncharacterized protein (DUF697 family)
MRLDSIIESYSSHLKIDAMHNIDRTVGEMGYEFNNEFNQENYEQFELNLEGGYNQEWEQENDMEYMGEYQQEAGLNEELEMELAAELLNVTNEQELDQFLGKLIKKAAGAVKTFARSSAGRAIGGILKSAAKKALPIAGAALGTAFGGPLGGSIGGKLGSMATKLFELELEGMSNEDKEFEVARAYVRFANDAVKKAARNPRHRYVPNQVAKQSVVSAAQRYAPGYLRRRRPYRPAARPVQATDWTAPAEMDSNGSSGTWYREGNQIILNL